MGGVYGTEGNLSASKKVIKTSHGGDTLLTVLSQHIINHLPA